LLLAVAEATDQQEGYYTQIFHKARGLLTSRRL
jgi:hypothetical protein